MKTNDEKKTFNIDKNGWMPVLIISGGLILFIIILKLFLAWIGQSA